MTETFRLADELFLIGLDDRVGVHVLQPHILGVGLAGALLGELVLAGHVTIDTDRVVAAPGPPPADRLGGQVLALLAAEPQHSLRTWLTYLAEDATGNIGDRLVREHRLNRVQPRWLSRVTYQLCGDPAQKSGLAWHRPRLRRAIEHRAVGTLHERTLCGLIHATGLSRHILRYSTPAARLYLQRLIRQLDRHRAVRDLVACVASLAADHGRRQRRCRDPRTALDEHR